MSELFTVSTLTIHSQSQHTKRTYHPVTSYLFCGFSRFQKHVYDLSTCVKLCILYVMCLHLAGCYTIYLHNLGKSTCRRRCVFRPPRSRYYLHDSENTCCDGDQYVSSHCDWVALWVGISGFLWSIR